MTISKQRHIEDLALFHESKKKCFVCLEIKHLDSFYKDARHWSGKQRRCKDCSLYQCQVQRMKVKADPEKHSLWREARRFYYFRRKTKGLIKKRPKPYVSMQTRYQSIASLI